MVLSDGSYSLADRGECLPACLPARLPACGGFPSRQDSLGTVWGLLRSGLPDVIFTQSVPELC